MTLRASASTRLVGPAVIVALVLALAVLWMGVRPTTEVRVASYVGQLIGAESILLMSVGLVLISTLPWVEVWFDGIDKAAIWHRRVAIIGVVLLLPHILISKGGRGPWWSGPAGIVATVGLAALVVWAVLPRWRSVLPRPARRVVERVHEWSPLVWLARVVGNYEVWRTVHRTTGLFVAIGLAHALGDGTPYSAAPVLRWSLVVIGGVGLAFYVYRELLARRGSGLRDYQVVEVQPVSAGLNEIVLAPLGRPLSFSPGQFAMLHLEAKDGWHRHPFTIASAPSAPTIRFTIKALGDYTSNLQTLVRPGMPAVISGPHGRFSHAKGADRQVWIAGGVGVTPFLSWFRSLDTYPPAAQVEFFYSIPDEAPYADELLAIADRHLGVRVHVVRTRSDERLTAQRALEPFRGDPKGVSVFMCGPDLMLRSLQGGFRQAGVPTWHIHREYFDWR